MAGMSDNPNLQHTQAIVQLLADHQATNTVALDVGEICSFADYFVIATVTSQGHLRGLIMRLDELLREHDITPLKPRRRGAEAGWVLIDLGFVIVHLMTAEMREFYELERLWFGAEEVFPAPPIV